jgi:hypothetical protein
MYGAIPNFPCSTGEVCFGAAGVTRGKGTPGTLTTISWNTSPGASGCTTADQSPPGGQCRHQQVCVVGFGATLQCTAGCSVTCGSSSTLRATAVGPANRGPFTFTLTGNGTTQTQSKFGDPSGTTIVDFTVNPTQSPTATYLLTVADKDNCTRTDTTTVAVSTTTTTITPPSTPACNGVLVYTGFGQRLHGLHVHLDRGRPVAGDVPRGWSGRRRACRAHEWHRRQHVLVPRARQRVPYDRGERELRQRQHALFEHASVKAQQCVGAPSSCN